MHRLVTLALLLSATSCVVPALPPEAPEDPVKVYLLLEGEHAGVILPNGGSGWVEFSYGDWGWVVMGRETPCYASFALFTETEGALGRRNIQGHPSADAFSLARGSRFQPFYVERSHVQALRTRLDAEFEREGEEPFFNQGFGLEYVHALHDYDLFHHCAHATIEWLQDLGCDVSDSGIIRSVEMRGIEPEYAVGL
ncbi:MAG: hypothetical protein ACYTEP_06610 [Planctomycetota bacterium]|jgi:hypothetical protein